MLPDDVPLLQSPPPTRMLESSVLMIVLPEIVPEQGEL